MKILICEDESAICRIIRVTLEPRGHEVHCAADVNEGIKLFDAAAKSGQPYELIITDVYMPGPSGFSLAGYVRGAGYTGRLAVLTGSEPELGNLATVQAEYWPKPDALGNLIERVETSASNPS